MYTNFKLVKFGCIRVILFPFIFSFLIILYPEAVLSENNPNLKLYKFEHLTMSEGLSYNMVEVILQDHKGYIWIGTRDGLNKYDGYEITVFKNDPDDSLSLRDNVIEAIYEDRDGVLWVGTQNGWLEKYDRQNQTFSHYHVGSHVLSIIEDRNGYFWIGTQNPGVLTFNRETGDTTLIQQGSFFVSFLEDQQGDLWTISSQLGLGKFDPPANRFHFNDFGFPLSSMIERQPGVLMLGSLEDGLIIYNHLNGKKEFIRHLESDPRTISSNRIRSLFKDSSNNFWIATFDMGLNRLKPDMKTATRLEKDSADPLSMNDNHLTTIFQDRGGVIWVGTTFGGVNKLSLIQSGFNHVYHIPENQNSLSDNVVNAILEDQMGMLWIGTEKGLNRFNRLTNTWHHYFYEENDRGSIDDNYILSLFEDSRGALWIGTGNGLNQYDRQNDRFIRYTAHPIHDMLEEKDGQLLLATREGLYQFDPYVDKKFTLLRSGYCWKISLLKDSMGMLWLGSSGCGVERYNPETGEWKLFAHDPKKPNSLSNDFIEAIIEDKSGNLWFTTAGGLNRFDPESEKFTNYREKEGLARDWIQGLLEDNKGNLWLSTADGISSFDPLSEKFTNYMLDRVNNYSYRRGAHFVSKTGEMFFGGSNGLTSFFPGQIENNLHIPPIVVTKLNVFNQPFLMDLPSNKKIELSYKQNFLSFDFASLDYTKPEKNLYAYKMEGLDQNWNYTGTRRHADYPDLKPGEYIFRVKGSNNDGLWNEAGISLEIQITPPFWQTWWFRTMVIFSIIGAVITAYKARVRYLEQKKKDLELRVKEKTESAIALQNALDEVESLKNRLQAENIYLQDEIRDVYNFEDIVTQSEAFKQILKSVEQVAATEATVLILGESGTGKELIARAVHNISARSNRLLIKVNCAALPANLIESELFGHEKGAFTGAISQKSGRFESADGGTIFLDEIGDLPLDLQAKLLRVLQEGEFERLGNPKSIKVDVRIIAATNHDLEKEVQKGIFREDLFYRLNVFPIHIPPLRNRKEDISLLVRHFVQKYSTKAGKQVFKITHDVIRRLEDYPWPGNVRELENIIERAIIISPEDKLIIGDWLPKNERAIKPDTDLSLEEIEKKHILDVLEKTNWRVSGDRGAAKILGLKRTTLEARMQKLGISKKR
jgi:DNA-binding NtrC family response regulator/ligand-binding sensor domain-containing protein